MAQKKTTTIDPLAMFRASASEPENPILAPSQTQTGRDLDLRKKQKKKVRVQAMVPPELFDKLKETADQNETSISEVAAKILAKYYS